MLIDGKGQKVKGGQDRPRSLALGVQKKTTTSFEQGLPETSIVLSSWSWCSLRSSMDYAPKTSQEKREATYLVGDGVSSSSVSLCFRLRPVPELEPLEAGGSVPLVEVFFLAGLRLLEAGPEATVEVVDRR